MTEEKQTTHSPPLLPPERIAGYVTQGFEHWNVIRLQKWIDIPGRLLRELELRQPPQAFPEDSDEEESKPQPQPQIPTIIEACARRVVDLCGKKAKREAEERRKSPMSREKRFRKARQIQLSRRRAALAISQVDCYGPYLPVGKGYQYDPGCMEDSEYEFDELVGRKSRFKMRCNDWNGIESVAIVDRDGKVVAVLGGSPRLNSWKKDVATATQLCAEAAPQVRRSDAEKSLGSSPSLTGGMGLTHEGEPARPAPGQSLMLDLLMFSALLAHPAIRRVAGYASCLFSIFAANMYDAFSRCLGFYEAHYTNSRRPILASVFSAATFLLGNNPRKVMDDDIAWGWSAFTALGNFNADKGGHIIFWDFNLVVRFPAGSTILFPRALIRHSFVEIAPNETRYCLVQFTPAPVFHFAENHNQSDLNFAKYAVRGSHEYREERRVFERTMLPALDYLTHIDKIPENYHQFSGPEAAAEPTPAEAPETASTD